MAERLVEPAIRGLIEEAIIEVECTEVLLGLLENVGHHGELNHRLNRGLGRLYGLYVVFNARDDHTIDDSRQSALREREEIFRENGLLLRPDRAYFLDGIIDGIETSFTREVREAVARRAGTGNPWVGTEEARIHRLAVLEQSVDPHGNRDIERWAREQGTSRLSGVDRPRNWLLRGLRRVRGG